MGTTVCLILRNLDLPFIFLWHPFLFLFLVLFDAKIISQYLHAVAQIILGFHLLSNFNYLPHYLSPQVNIRERTPEMSSLWNVSITSSISIFIWLFYLILSNVGYSWVETNVINKFVTNILFIEMVIYGSTCNIYSVNFNYKMDHTLEFRWISRLPHKDGLLSYHLALGEVRW